MKYGPALDRLRESVPMRRSSWINPHCYVRLTPDKHPDPFGINNWRGQRLTIHLAHNDLAGVAWTPTVQDQFAEDWEVFVMP